MVMTSTGDPPAVAVTKIFVDPAANDEDFCWGILNPPEEQVIDRYFRGVTGDVEDWIVRNVDESAASVRQPLDNGLATLEPLTHEVELAVLGEQVSEAGAAALVDGVTVLGDRAKDLEGVVHGWTPMRSTTPPALHGVAEGGLMAMASSAGLPLLGIVTAGAVWLLAEQPACRLDRRYEHEG